MKKLFTIILCLFIGWQLSAQNCYWVFFTDKEKTSFDPYQYFDSKAIERYQQNHLDLYDITNYPLNQDYKAQVDLLTEEYVGESRWFNAVAVTATEEQIGRVQALPFVQGVRLILSEAILAQSPNTSSLQTSNYDAAMNQLALMNGEKFQQKNINGKGVRIAVFDGGFPDVNTHPAFKHLRDNHQIIKTWNFATQKENVYGNNEHGRMVLSCIAGIMNDSTLLGMAPGAEFLLARTEVEAEKRKEEVWWVQALEWADQNGASIVSSSLGYGKELHYTKDMDGKTTIVAKGARTAASKGILVCTAMGNEGGDHRWHYLVSPADADSVLSVGAVRSLERKEPYSSYGPTADGRRKPNVVACGYNMVAMGKGNYDYAQGTSFATPLVSGFAACVKQMHPEWNAMQLLEEIEKSANHYPYYDYAYGYGVPQADYFTEEPKNKKHSFDLQEDENYIYVIPVDPQNNHKLFYNVQNGDGSIEYCTTSRVAFETETAKIDSNTRHFYFISKSKMQNGQTLNIWFDDQYVQYVVGKDVIPAKDPSIDTNTLSYSYEFINRGFLYKKPSRYNGKLVLNASFILPTQWTANENIYASDRLSRTFTFSYENDWKLAQCYDLGLRIGFGSSWYALKAYNDPAGVYSETAQDSCEYLRKFNLKTSQFDLEFYQRFNLANCKSGKIYLDMGIYGDWITGSRLKCKTTKNTNESNVTENSRSVMVYKHYYRDEMNKLNAGVRLRFGFGKSCAIYGQYRFTNIFKNETVVDLPRWEIGVQFF